MRVPPASPAARLCTLGIIGLFCLVFVAGAAAEESLFRREVAPIFQRRCLSCHNDNDRKGEFSLQTVKSLSHDSIEPGKPAASYLLELLTTNDPSVRMPKESAPLAAAEVAAIRKWIAEGAPWPDGFQLEPAAVSDFSWWSFQPLRRPAVPATDSSWGESPVDAFILAQLTRRGLKPAADADRRTLIRRVTYDLTGLPPTPEEVRKFVEDQKPRAYQRLVDRLLQSKHYGERWARHWLDVVKYADTCGYDKDKLRPQAWPYRDYVIRSFNEDKPYGQFIQEQIAGDVLFPGEPDGILALGFIAAGPWDFIGHVEVPESKLDGKVARNLDRDDMVSNALNTFCSITVQCARCHNHKFDPITQEHYYGLQAIFAGVDRAERPYDLAPEVAQRRVQLVQQQERLQGELRQLQREVTEAAGPELPELQRRIAELGKRQQVRKAAEFGYHSAIADRPEVVKWVEVDLAVPHTLKAIVLRPCHDEFAGIGAGFGFPVRFRVEVAAQQGAWRVVADHTGADLPSPGLAPLEITQVEGPVRWIRLTATQLAERKNDYILALAEIQALDAQDRNLALRAAVQAADSIEAPTRWARKNLTDGLWAEGADPHAARELAAAERKQADLLARAETPARKLRRDKLERELADTRQQLAQLPKPRMVYAAATHFPPQGNFKPTEGKLRPIHLLHRGNIQQPGQPAAPGVLPLASKDDWKLPPELNEAERRAKLAQWLSDPSHPLVWRSIVNRVWHYHFGQGLVATPNDFGRMGAQPTHPELLDWLAVEFRDGNQSLKELHRLIVTSRVYQQASTSNPENARRDADNRFLWRMNRRRLSAEEIRDSLLQVSGALDQTMGGPGFYLFALEKTAHSPHYEYHKFDPADPRTHRRSIYRFIVRSQPDPWMTTLDCADSSQSTPKRNETLTALQALSLLNNRFNLEMAGRFASRLEREASDLPSQVDLAVELLLQRSPTEQERSELRKYGEHHGLTNLCRVLMNLSEFVYLD